MAEYNRNGKGFARPYRHQGGASDPDTYINLFVKAGASFDNNDRQVTNAGGGDVPIGIVGNANVDDTVSVIVQGQAFLKVNGNSTNIAVGDPLIPTTGGIGVKNESAGTEYYAIAQEEATEDGVLIEVTVERGHIAA